VAYKSTVDAVNEMLGKLTTIDANVSLIASEIGAALSDTVVYNREIVSASGSATIATLTSGTWIVRRVIVSANRESEFTVKEGATILAVSRVSAGHPIATIELGAIDVTSLTVEGINQDTNSSGNLEATIIASDNS